MTLRIIVGAVALACISVFGILATYANFEIIDKVNDKLPEMERFAPLGWYPFKYQRLKRRYRTFYPDGRLLLRVCILTALMLACVVIAAWGFGVFAK